MIVRFEGWFKGEVDVRREDFESRREVENENEDGGDDIELVVRGKRVNLGFESSKGTVERSVNLELEDQRVGCKVVRSEACLVENEVSLVEGGASEDDFGGLSFGFKEKEVGVELEFDE